MNSESTERKEEDGMANGITGPEELQERDEVEIKQMEPSDQLFLKISMPIFGLNESLPRHQAT
jgi:hypothetical protein